METIVVIGILTLAGVYVARVYYLKFKQGNSYEGGRACTGCGCSPSCNPGRMDGNCSPTVIVGDKAHPADLKIKCTPDANSIPSEACNCQQSGRDDGRERKL